MTTSQTPEATEKKSQKSKKNMVYTPNHQSILDALHIIHPVLQDNLQEKMNIAYDTSECLERLKTALSPQALKNFINPPKGVKNGWKTIDLYYCLKLIGKNSYNLHTKTDWDEDAISYCERIMYYRNFYIGHASNVTNISDETLTLVLSEIAAFCHPLDHKKEKQILAMIPKKKTSAENQGLCCLLKDYYALSRECFFSFAFTDKNAFDVTCFGLAENKMLTTPDDDYLVFYNQLESVKKEIQLTINPQETLNTFRLKFLELPQEIRRLVFTITISNETKKNLTELSECRFSVKQEDKPELSLSFSGTKFSPDDTAAILVEVYRGEDNFWKLSFPACGVRCTLEDLIKKYGGSVVD